MKKAIVFALVLIGLAAGHATAALTVTPSSLTLASGQTGTLTLSNGSGFYNIQSSDTSVATVSFAGSTVTVVALTKGSITLTIKDGTDTVTVPVDVDPSMSVSTNTVHLLEGEAQVVTVSQGVLPIDVDDASPMVSAVLNGSDLTITGTLKGDGAVTLTDAVGDTVVIDVVVYLPLTCDPDEVNVAETGTGTLTVTEGIPPYTVVSADTAVASAAVSGSTVTVTGNTVGTTTLTITDSALSPNVLILDVDVDTFNVSVTELMIDLGGQASFDILDDGSGSNFYNVSVVPSGVVTVAISGNSVELDSVGDGTATVTVEDSTGESKAVTVTVSSGLGLSESDFTMNDGEVEPLTISGGVWPYTITTSPAGVVDVPATWYGYLPFDVEAVNTGTTTLTVTDTAGDTVSLTITVLPVSLSLGVKKVGVSVGESVSVKLFGGTGYYSLIVNDPLIADADLGADAVTVTGVFPGVTAVTIQDSAMSTVDLAVVTRLPAPVLILTQNGNAVSLTWPAVQGADHYILYFAPPDSGGNADLSSLSSVNLGNVTSLDVKLASGDSYFVAVQSGSSLEPDTASVVSNVADFTIP